MGDSNEYRVVAYLYFVGDSKLSLDQSSVRFQQSLSQLFVIGKCNNQFYFHLNYSVLISDC